MIIDYVSNDNMKILKIDGDTPPDVFEAIINSPIKDLSLNTLNSSKKKSKHEKI